jgi:hypothetical protein
MDTPVLDHLIIGENNYLSFADEGFLWVRRWKSEDGRLMNI